jgi:hypothetical protein
MNYIKQSMNYITAWNAMCSNFEIVIKRKMNYNEITKKIIQRGKGKY